MKLKLRQVLLPSCARPRAVDAVCAAPEPTSSISKAAGAHAVLVDCGAPSRPQSSAASEEEETWHDCEEAWPADQGCSLEEEQQLPPRLASIVARALAGDPEQSPGCKPTAALVRWMQDSGTSVDQLRALLAPLMQGEREQLVPQLTPLRTPDEVTAALRRQQQEPPRAADRQQQQQQPQQSQAALLAHLLDNVALVCDTLAAMELRDDAGWRQVASGAMQLWYCHTGSSQRILAKCILPEPLPVVAALTREVDLVPSWNSCMAAMCEVGRYSATELLVYICLWMPFPLPWPEVPCSYALGVDLLDCRAQPCVLMATQHRAPPPGVERPVTQGLRRTLPLEIASGYRLVPLLPDDGAGASSSSAATPATSARTEVVVLASIDAGRFSVPDAVVTIILHVVAPLIFKCVVKALHAFGHTGPLAERRALRPEYASLATRTARCLGGLAAVRGGSSSVVE